ncbi:MAG: amidohydrolase family protein [Ilumatobacteraceae bacterium]
MIIDAFTHIYPPGFLEQLTEHSSGLGNLTERMKSAGAVVNLEQRFSEMDPFGDYRQVIALPHPVLEEVATPGAATMLASVANDAMAELCSQHPDRFAAFVATVAMTDVDGAVVELRRAVTELGAKGVQIYTNVVGRPLDDPEFEPMFATIADLGVTTWLHPARTAAMTDYATEERSRYEMWWCFGWPYETSVAMSRLVFAGVFDRYPTLRILTHHLGGMVPYFDGRIGPGMEYLGSRTADEDYSAVLDSLQRPHLDYFKMFYADTALFGSSTGLSSGLQFFGADHVLFASDAPFGPIAPTIAALDQVDLDPADRRKIMSGNAIELFGLDVATEVS